MILITMKSIIKLFRPLLIIMMRSWWYITRPKTSGAKVIIICNDEILLIKTTYGYNYSLPGGGIKKHEDPKAAAIREAQEEVGIELHTLTSLPSFVTYEEYKEDTVHSFYTTVTSYDYTLDALEIDSAEWHPLNNLPKLGPVTTKIVKLYNDLHHA
jgi:8-oxo-dGTP pyrophosphatase MutT (NUDIX family)